MSKNAKIGIITLLVTGTAVVALAATSLYGPGVTPPPASLWASTDQATWGGDTIRAGVGRAITFRATTPLGAALPSTDGDAVDGASADQGVDSFVCEWDFAAAAEFTVDATANVGATVTRTFDKPGTYIVACRTNDIAGTVYDDPPTPATTTLTVIVGPGADDEQALSAITQAQALLAQGKWTEAKGLLLGLLDKDLSTRVRTQVLDLLVKMGEDVLLPRLNWEKAEGTLIAISFRDLDPEQMARARQMVATSVRPSLAPAGREVEAGALLAQTEASLVSSDQRVRLACARAALAVAAGDASGARVLCQQAATVPGASPSQAMRARALAAYCLLRRGDWTGARKEHEALMSADTTGRLLHEFLRACPVNCHILSARGLYWTGPPTIYFNGSEVVEGHVAEPVTAVPAGGAAQ